MARIWNTGKIGDYVHYSWDNYLKYSLNKPISDIKQNGLSDATKAFNQQRNKLKKKATSLTNKESIKAKLEAQLNFFYNPSENMIKLGLGDAEAQNLLNKIIEVFERLTEKELRNAIVDYDDLSAYKNAINNKEAQKTINKYRSLNEPRSTYKAIKARMELLTKNKNLFPNEDLKTKITQLENTYDSIMKDVGDKKGLTKQNTETTDFIRELNKIIKEAKVQNDKKLLGIVGEYMSAIIPFILNNRINLSVDEIVEQFKKGFNNKNGNIDFVVGDNRSYKVLNSSNFIGNATLNEFFDGTKLNLSYTQDKVDAYLEYENSYIPASIKNVNQFAKDIHILKGTSILKYCQNDYLFTNHYLNLTSSHEEGYMSHSLIQDAHNLMKLTIGVGALQGGLYSMSKDGNHFYYGPKAELFVVNEHGGIGKGNFKVYFIDDLIESIIKNVNYLTIKEYDNPIWNNKWAGVYNIPNYRKANSRIAKILQELNTFQLDVSISKQALI